MGGFCLRWTEELAVRNLVGAAVPCHCRVAAADISAALAEKQTACTSGLYIRGSAPLIIHDDVSDVLT